MCQLSEDAQLQLPRSAAGQVECCNQGGTRGFPPVIMDRDGIHMQSYEFATGVLRWDKLLTWSFGVTLPWDGEGGYLSHGLPSGGSA